MRSKPKNDHMILKSILGGVGLGVGVYVVILVTTYVVQQLMGVS